MPWQALESVFGDTFRYFQKAAPVPAMATPEPWQQTYSGGRFYPLHPRVTDVKLEDLAHHLALANRFLGATRMPYSVAQHSVLVSMRLEDLLASEPGLGERAIMTAALYGLLHDGAEAYLTDIPSPVKAHPLLAGYRAAEQLVQAAVYQAFGLDPAREPLLLKVVDRRMLRTEQRDLLRPVSRDDDRKDYVDPYPNRIHPIGWAEAEQMFMARYYAIRNELNSLA